MTKKIISFILAILIIIVSIPMQSVYAFTPDDFLGNLEWSKMTDTEKWGCIFNFTVAEIGAVVHGDAASFISGMSSMQEFMSKNEPDDYVDGDNIVIPKELVILIKQCLDEYAKTEQTKEENGGFMLVPTMKMDDVPASFFKNAVQYQSFRGVVSKYGMLAIISRNAARYNNFTVCNPFKNKNTVLVDAEDYLDEYKKDNTALVNCSFYDCVNWKYLDFEMRYCNATGDTPVFDLENFTEYPLASTTSLIVSISKVWTNGNSKNVNSNNITSNTRLLCSADGRRVRVFVSEDAAINYSVAKRKVYFTKNYYNYVPEDLTVSIDDLQKSVDDLQAVIDKLLEQISNDTSENDIEELLKQILDELRKNPGIGSGSGSGGGGNVTVDIDLSTTNSWLKKIHESIEALKETLVKYLKTITSDLGDIKDQLKDMSEEEFEEKTDSFLDSATGSFSEIGELAKTKFPLSIPYDLYNLLAAISPKPSEASTFSLLPAEQTTKSYSSSAFYQSNGRIISVSDGAESVGETVQLSSTGAPVFHLPIVVESVGWDYAITVDMSRFQSVANLSRTFFTLIFILGLINLTIKIAGLWGDLID